MSPANPEWPVLLGDYETAAAAFESASRALTAALTARSATDEDLRGLISSEETAREAVILARMRLINLWRESSAEVQEPPAPMSPVPRSVTP